MPWARVGCGGETYKINLFYIYVYACVCAQEWDCGHQEGLIWKKWGGSRESYQDQEGLGPVSCTLIIC